MHMYRSKHPQHNIHYHHSYRMKERRKYHIFSRCNHCPNNNLRIQMMPKHNHHWNMFSTAFRNKRWNSVYKPYFYMHRCYRTRIHIDPVLVLSFGCNHHWNMSF